MSAQKLWTAFNRRTALAYPYTPQRNIHPTASDRHGRNLLRLFKSYVSLGRKLLNGDTTAINQEDVLRAMRICENRIELRDIDFFSSILEQAMPTDTSIVLTCDKNIKTDESVGWNQLLQVIFLHPISATKVSVYFVSLRTNYVDVYAIGLCRTEELQQFALQISNYLLKVSPGRTFSFRYRLEIPSSFEKDHLMMAFVLAVQLHCHGKYLSLNNRTLMVYKVLCLNDFDTLHDRWFGQLKLTKGEYPFIRKSPDIEDVLMFKEMGWALIDVPGDGNCAYFSFLLGLDNHGRTTFNPHHYDEHGVNFEGGREIEEDALLLEWRKQTLRLRKALRKHSIKLLSKTYPPGQEPTWWWEWGPMDPADRTSNSDSFYQRGLLLQHYFLKGSKTLEAQHHVLVPWGPFVFASMAKMRVVVIQKVTHPENGFNFATLIFSGEDNVEPQREERIVRLSDDDFRRVPTIEIYHTGGEGIDNHIQFLHRVFRDDATGTFPEPDEVRLLDVIKRRYKEPQSESDRVALNELDVEQSQEERSESGDEATNELDEHVQQSIQPDPMLNAEDSQRNKKKPSQESISRQKTVDIIQQSQEERSESREEALNEPLQSGDEATNELDEHVQQSIQPDPMLNAEDSQRNKKNPSQESIERQKTVDIIQQSQEERSESREEALNEPLLQSDPTQAIDENAGDDDSLNEPIGLELNQDPHGNEAQVETNNERLHVARGKTPIARGKTPAVQPTTRGKTPRAKKARHDVLMAESSKRMRTRRSQDIAYDEEFFDSAYHANTLKHKMPARMKYDPVLDAYFACYVRGFNFSAAEEVTTKLVEFDDILVNQAKQNPNEWQGCSIGDSFDGIVPAKLATSVKIPFRQYNERFCLTLSLANALDYCNFTDEAKVLASQAPFFAEMTGDLQLNRLIGFMRDLVPLIGRPTRFSQSYYRENPDNTKRRVKKARLLTFDTLFSEIIPHPTLVIPALSDGTSTHAFCIVDDLIFDSCFSSALKLKKESIDWIFNDTEVEIFQALRFNLKHSPKGTVVEGHYDREVMLHWDMPSRVFIKRDKSSWRLPHYITKT